MINQAHKDTYVPLQGLLRGSLSTAARGCGTPESIHGWTQAPFGVSSETSFWLPVLASAIWVFYFGTYRGKPFRADLSQPLEPLRYWLPSPIRRLFNERQWELTPRAILRIINPLILFPTGFPAVSGRSLRGVRTVGRYFNLPHW